MYLQFYQLRQAPFQAGADAAFFWKGEKYRQALQVLQRAVEHGGGVSLLTGDVGTGKTAVVHELLRRLGRDVSVCLISDPSLTIPDFYQLVLHAFRIRRAVTSRADFHRHLDGLLQKSGRRHRKILVIIDEAQRLSPELAAELAQMAKISAAAAGALHLSLVGQTDPGRRALAPVMGALTKHISADFHIAPLDPAETAGYIRHRLTVAGAEHEIFGEEALAEVFRHSEGYPIQINLICDFSLFSGFAERAPVITEDIVRWSAESLRLPDIIEEPAWEETEEEESPQEDQFYETADESVLDEGFADADDVIIEPDAALSSADDGAGVEPDAGEAAPVGDKPVVSSPAEKPVQPAAPRKPVRPFKKPDFTPGPRRRSLLKPSLAAAVLLLVAGGGFLLYSFEYGSLSGLLERFAPGVSATAEAPAPPEGLPEPVPSAGSDSAGAIDANQTAGDRITETEIAPEEAVSIVPDAKPPAAAPITLPEAPPADLSPQQAADQSPQPQPAAVQAPALPRKPDTLTVTEPAAPEPPSAPAADETAGSDTEPPAVPVKEAAAPPSPQPAATPSNAAREPAVTAPEPLQGAAAPPAATHAQESAGTQRADTAAAIVPAKEVPPAEALSPSPVAAPGSATTTATAVAAEPAAEAEKAPAAPAPAAEAAPMPATMPDVPDVSEKPTPPAVAARVEKPAAPLPAPSDVQAADPEKASSPTAPDQETPPPAATANKQLKDILEAGAFSSQQKPSSATTEKPATAGQPSPEAAAAPEHPPAAAAPDDPDPSAVINWLLKKKGK